MIVGTICRKGEPCQLPKVFPPVQRFLDFMADLEELAQYGHTDSDSSICQKDIWRISIINGGWALEGGEWGFIEDTSHMYDSYCALSGRTSPPKECPDIKKWCEGTRITYLGGFRHAYGRRPFLTAVI
jgi:hypothetical protein